MCPFTGRPIDGMQEKVESAEDPFGGNAFPSFIAAPLHARLLISVPKAAWSLERELFNVDRWFGFRLVSFDDVSGVELPNRVKPRPKNDRPASVRTESYNCNSSAVENARGIYSYVSI
jgi:hypothetical protein